jgi:spermidine synthase
VRSDVDSSAEDAQTGPTRRKKRFLLGGLLLGAALATLIVVAVATGRSTVVFLGVSDLGTAVRVVEQPDGLRVLYLGGGRARQTAIYPNRPTHLELAYSRVAMVGLALVPPDARILMVGLGGGAMPTYIHTVRPEARIDVVELDPLVVQVAQRYFGFTPDSAMRIHTGDGRAFIENAPTRRWDLILLDAFSDTEIPRALTTRQFLEAVRHALSVDGVVVSNVPSNGSLYTSMVATYEAVFPQVHLVRVPWRAQRILLAAPASRALDRASLISASEHLAEESELNFDLPGLVRRGYERPPTTGALVLEDSGNSSR